MWSHVGTAGYYSVWMREDGKCVFVAPMDDASRVCNAVDRYYPAQSAKK